MLTKVISKTGATERYVVPAPEIVLLITLVNISGAGTTYLSAVPVLLITLVNISGVGTTYLSAASGK
jgi:uncharacterized membrane protein